MEYGYKKVVNIDFDKTEARLQKSLSEHGFGVITEIDVKNIFKQKLNINFKKYKILGACQPQVAYKALSLDEQIGLLLPCNLVIWENEDKSTTVAAIDPRAQLSLAGCNELIEHSKEINNNIKAVVDSL